MVLLVLGFSSVKTPDFPLVISLNLREKYGNDKFLITHMVVKPPFSDQA